MRLPSQLVRPVVALGSSVFTPPVPVAVQRFWLEALYTVAPLPAGTRVAGVRLGRRRAERVCADGAGNDAAVLLLHGGAFVVGSPRTHRVLAAHLSAAARRPVYVLDHRRSPEHPHPAALHDARAAYEALAAQVPTAVVGDSAGGALALMLAQELRDHAGAEPQDAAEPQALVLLSPLVDLTLAASSAYRGPDPVLAPAWLRQGTGAFLGGQDGAAVSPLAGDLAGLPPTLVHVGEQERLRPEGEALVEKLRHAGVEVELEVLAGLWHDAHLQAHLVGAAADAVARAGRWLLGQPAGRPGGQLSGA